MVIIVASGTMESSGGVQQGCGGAASAGSWGSSGPWVEGAIAGNSRSGGSRVGGEVVLGGGKRRLVEAHVGGGGDGSTDESGGRGVGVGCASGAGGVVFGNDFGDCGIEVSEEVVLEIARYARELGVVCL